jgi:hypothetical protein
MRHRARGYPNAALLLTSVSASVLLIELGGHSLAAELTFQFLKDQHIVPFESPAS